MVLLFRVVLDLHDAIGGVLVGLFGWPPHRLLKVIEDTLYPLGLLREPEPLFLEQFSFLLPHSGYPDVGVLGHGELGA